MKIDDTITVTTVITKRQGILSSELDDDIIMANIENGHYYGISNTSKRIWNLIERPVSIESICNTLVKEYDVSFDVCVNSVISFVQELIREGLVEKVMAE